MRLCVSHFSTSNHFESQFPLSKFLNLSKSILTSALIIWLKVFLCAVNNNIDMALLILVSDHVTRGPI